MNIGRPGKHRMPVRTSLLITESPLPTSYPEANTEKKRDSMRKVQAAVVAGRTAASYEDADRIQAAIAARSRPTEQIPPSYRNISLAPSPTAKPQDILVGALILAVAFGATYYGVKFLSGLMQSANASTGVLQPQPGYLPGGAAPLPPV